MTHSLPGNEKHIPQPGFYKIRIKEGLGSRLACWFNGMTISQAENGETVLTGPILDKAALHGLLAKIGELNLTLVSVIQLKSPEQTNGEFYEK